MTWRGRIALKPSPESTSGATGKKSSVAANAMKSRPRIFVRLEEEPILPETLTLRHAHGASLEHRERAPLLGREASPVEGAHGSPRIEGVPPGLRRDPPRPRAVL